MENKRIKILVCITGFNVGGAEVAIHSLITNLNKNVFDVVVVSLLKIGPVGFDLKDKNIKTYELLVNKNKFLGFFLAVSKLMLILKKEKPDILHTNLFHADIIGRIAGKIARVPFIMSTIHNIGFNSILREFILRYTRWMVDGNIAIADVVYNYAVSHKVSNKNKLRIIYYGISNEYFLPRETSLDLRQKLSLGADEFVIIAIGRLVKQKGYEFLLEGFKNIQNTTSKKIKLIILGEGKDGDMLKKIAAHISTDSIRFIGNVSNVKEYLQASDVFILSSLWEGYALVVVEAAASRVPIISTKVGISPEFIVDGENGFLINPYDSFAITNALEKVLNMSEGERKKIGERAFTNAKEKFFIDRMITEYENYYKSKVK